MLFRDRIQAGQRLAEKLTAYADNPDVLILALPRGGVPVAYEVAKTLHSPLDIFVVRKLGVPGHEELAMGAIASGGVVILNQDIVQGLNIPEDVIHNVAKRELREIERRETLYRDNQPLPHIEGRTIVLIDDGLATGATMRAAVRALRQKNPAQIIVAVPVASRQTCDDLRREVDYIVCAVTPQAFHAVGLWYDDFTQTSDDDVRMLLTDAWKQPVAAFR